VARAALEGADPTAVESVALFFRCFGAFAGDLALTVDARGGVYICGGVTPRLLPLLRRGDFKRAFCAKGGHGALAVRYPIKVVLDPRLGLRGAAHLAAAACTNVDTS
jgi:glucokinase